MPPTLTKLTDIYGKPALSIQVVNIALTYFSYRFAKNMDANFSFLSVYDVQIINKPHIMFQASSNLTLHPLLCENAALIVTKTI